MSMKCGNCKGSHETVLQVRSCYNLENAGNLGREAARSGDDFANAYVVNHPEEFGRDDIRRARKALATTRTDPDSAARSMTRNISREASGFSGGNPFDNDHQFSAPATEKQCEFIARLRKERELDELPFSGTKKQASAEISRLLDLPKAAPELQDASPLLDVPAGHYAIRSMTGNNDLDFFRVDRPTEGQYAGRTFVQRIIGGRSDTPVRGKTARAALDAIVTEGITEAATLYGKELDRCVKCNRHLTDDESRHHVPPMGPDCRAKAGF